MKRDIEYEKELEQRISSLIDELDAAERILDSQEESGTAHSIPEKATSADDATEKKTLLWNIIRKRVIGIAAACIILAAGILTFERQERNAVQLTDTFDNPELAYAEVERVLNLISEKSSAAHNSIENVESRVEKQIDKIRPGGKVYGKRKQ